jgi:hypothetical protein
MILFNRRTKKDMSYSNPTPDVHNINYVRLYRKTTESYMTVKTPKTMGLSEVLHWINKNFPDWSFCAVCKVTESKEEK